MKSVRLFGAAEAERHRLSGHAETGDLRAGRIVDQHAAGGGQVDVPLRVDVHGGSRHRGKLGLAGGHAAADAEL